MHRIAISAFILSASLGTISCTSDVAVETGAPTTSSAGRLSGELGGGVRVTGDEAAVASFLSPGSRRIGAPSPVFVAKPTKPSLALPTTSPTDKAVRHAASIPGEANVDVQVFVRAKDFDFSRFAQASDTGRPALVAERAAQVASDLDSVEARIRAISGSIRGRNIVGNSLAVTVRARDLKTLVSFPEVTEIERDYSAFKSLVTPSNGVLHRNETLANRYLTAGVYGQSGSRVDGYAIRLGILELATENVTTAGVEKQNTLSWNHPGFKYSGGGLRKWATRFCNDSGCAWEDYSSQLNGYDHGTFVTSAAAGSIELGQDATFSGVFTTEQAKRSGHAPRSDIYYYRMQPSCSALAQALSYAVIGNDRPDILNMSFGLDLECEVDSLSTICARNELKAATDAGILLVAGTGNDSDATSGGTSCRLLFPAFKTETIAVAGLDIGTHDLDSGAWARGGVPGKVNGWPVRLAGVDLLAPTSAQYDYGRDSTQVDQRYYPAVVGGSSLAAPVVSGAAALVRHSFWAHGWPSSDAGFLRANLLLMGDGLGTTYETSVVTHGVNTIDGMGRLKLKNLWGNGLQAPWGWGGRCWTVQHGETWEFSVGDAAPESTSITQWRWVLAWDEQNLSDMSDIDLYVVDKCPPGGGEQLVTYETGYDVRNRIELKASSIGGRCLTMRVNGYRVAAGGKRVCMADFYHSGSTSNE